LSPKKKTNSYSLVEDAIRQNIQYGDFDLSSGGVSNYYFDIKPLLLNSIILHEIAGRLWCLIGAKQDVIAGIGYSGSLLISAMLTFCPKEVSGLIVRTEKKTHGLCSRIEGNSSIHDREVVLVDDVLSTGGNLRVATNALKEIRNCTVSKWVVLVDRSHAPILSAPEIVSVYKAENLIL